MRGQGLLQFLVDLFPDYAPFVDITRVPARPAQWDPAAARNSVHRAARLLHPDRNWNLRAPASGTSPIPEGLGRRAWRASCHRAQRCVADTGLFRCRPTAFAWNRMKQPGLVQIVRYPALVQMHVARIKVVLADEHDRQTIKSGEIERFVR